jgi:solute:Na+ symporter, SSS family
VGTMVVSGFFPAGDAAYKRRVDAFFTRLATPIPEEQKPKTDPAFRRALTMIFAAAFAGAGSLFLLASIPSLNRLSGLLALAAGLLCFVLAALLYRLAARWQVRAPFVDKSVNSASLDIA